MKTRATRGGLTLTVESGLDVAGAAGARDAAVAALARAAEEGRRLTIELADGAPTAPALQLLIAADRAAGASGLAARRGPRAASALAAVQPKERA